MKMRHKSSRCILWCFLLSASLALPNSSKHQQLQVDSDFKTTSEISTSPVESFLPIHCFEQNAGPMETPAVYFLAESLNQVGVSLTNQPKFRRTNISSKGTNFNASVLFGTSWSLTHLILHITSPRKTANRILKFGPPQVQLSPLWVHRPCSPWIDMIFFNTCGFEAIHCNNMGGVCVFFWWN